MVSTRNPGCRTIAAARTGTGVPGAANFCASIALTRITITRWAGPSGTRSGKRCCGTSVGTRKLPWNPLAGRQEESGEVVVLSHTLPTLTRRNTDLKGNVGKE